jgi:hypothetical protein
MDFIDRAMSYDNKSKLTIFAASFALYYMFTTSGFAVHNFFVVAFITIMLVFRKNQFVVKQKKHSTIEVFIAEMEKKVQTHQTPEMMLESSYKVHKPLKDLYHVKKNKEVKETIYKLNFLKIYDNEQYIDVVVLLEYFFKIHFNVMIVKYDYHTNMDVLTDVKNEIINSLYTSYYNIPKISKTVDVDVDKELRQCIIKLQSIMTKYMRIAKHKFEKNRIDEKTRPIDPLKNSSYHLVY